MQLTELLFQRVKELGGQGQLALRPGYVAIVSRASTVRVALVAALFPGAEDQRRLVDGAEGPGRVGVGLVVSPGGAPYRILRELGGSRQLQKQDPATKKFAQLSEDSLEIDSFLRVECGLPPADVYANFFVIEQHELPSARAKALSGPALSVAQVDQPKVQALREELELTRRFEGFQDALFKVQQRLHELGEMAQKLRVAEEEFRAADEQAQRSSWTPEQIKELTRRAAGAKNLQKRREEQLGEVVSRRQRAGEETAAPVQLFLQDPWFGGGIAGGLALDALAFVFKAPWVALLGLLPYAAALVSVLRWIQADEAEKESVRHLESLAAREKQLKKTFDDEAAPLKAALKAANVGSAEELSEIFKQREEVLARRDEAKARYDLLLQDPELAKVAAEMPGLEIERRKLEQEVGAQGFARAVGEIEKDLKVALGLSEAKAVPGSKSGAGQPTSEGEMPKLLVARAAELLGVLPEDLWAQAGQRLSAYLAALTDQRVASAKFDAKGALLLVAADGRQGLYLGMPPPLRDLCYAALRLLLLEKVVAAKKLPVVIDDAFAVLEPAKRQLIAKMLKSLGTQTQILHRSAEPPAAGVADHVVQAGLAGPAVPPGPAGPAPAPAGLA